MTPSRPDRRIALRIGAATGASSAFPLIARAQSWPSQSIRFVIPFAPGGSSEIVARAAAAELPKLLGQSVYVDNKPGGAGNVAMGEVARAEDQHTLVLGHIGTLAVNPYLFDKLPHDLVKDFRPISLLAKVPSLYVLHPDVPAKNMKEFVALCKAKPGPLNYGSAGNGSAGHLAFEYLKTAAGIFILHVPYRGTGPQLTDLLAGRLQAALVGAPAILAVHQDRQAALHRHRHAATHCTVARCAQRGRAGLPRFRDDAVVRHACAGQPATGRGGPAFGRRDEGDARAHGAGTAERRCSDPGRRHGRRVRALHRHRATALEAGDRAGEGQARLKMTAPAS